MCGVPQGSILGPLLFLIYVNDVSMVVEKCKTVLHADDCTCLFPGADIEETISHINSDLAKLSFWYKANKLSLNANKSKAIIFAPWNVNVTTQSVITLESSNIEIVAHASILEVIFDARMSWRNHIDHICNKVSSGRIIYKLHNILGHAWLMRLYNSRILPFLNYCAIVWANTSKIYLNRLVILQKQALKTILKVPRITCSNVVFSKTNTLRLHDITETQMLIIMYKHSTGLLPLPLQEIFTKQAEVATRRTRWVDTYYIHPSQLSSWMSSFTHRAPMLWNNLLRDHPDIISSNPLDHFKNKLKAHYKSKSS